MAHELSLAELIEGCTGWRALKTPDGHRADLLVCLPGVSPRAGMLAWVEHNRRRMVWRQYPAGVVLAEQKLAALSSLEDDHGVPAWFVVTLDSGRTIWHRVGFLADYRRRERGGRTSATRDRWDVERVCLIDWGAFVGLSEALRMIRLVAERRASLAGGGVVGSPHGNDDGGDRA